LRSEIGFSETGDFHLVSEESEFERLIAMDGDDDAFAMGWFGEDMVAAVDAGEMPTAVLEKPHEIFTGNLFHAR